MSKNGIIISRKDVGDRKTVTFDGSKNTLKIDTDNSKVRSEFIKYTFGVAPPMGGATAITTRLITVEHNMGYIPAYIFYMYSYDIQYAYVYPGIYSDSVFFLGGGLAPYRAFNIYVTSKHLCIDIICGDPYGLIPAYDILGKSFGLKYMLFSNPLDPDA